MLEGLYKLIVDFVDSLPILSKPYLIIIIILLISIDMTLGKFYSAYKKAHPVKKEPVVFREKGKK